ncbi:MAG TPA: helix-turn-helix domain-containing protein [Pyrinomonadaceae bacterium]|jgi:excisionase family DNA binding protein
MPNNSEENAYLQILPTRRELFIESFRLWEQAGRGWQVFDYETALEPAVTKFIPPSEISRPADDGRKLSFWERLFSNRQNENLLSNQNVFSAENSENKQPRITVAVKPAAFQIYLPAELKLSSEQTEQLIRTLAATVSSFVGFEIIGTASEIILQIVCPETEKAAVFMQLKGYLPEVDFRESAEALCQNLCLERANETVLVDFGLGKEWFIPLAQAKNFAADTLLPLVAAIEELSEGETLCLQVLFCRARRDWQQAVREAIFDRAGKLVFANLQNYLPGIKEKLDQSFLAVLVRMAVQSESREKSVQIARRAGAFFRQLYSPAGNELIPLRNDGLSEENHLRSFLSRTSYRTGMLLSARELAAIVHLPSDSVKSAKLLRDKNLTKAAPDFAFKGELVLGENSHAGRVRAIALGTNLRVKHTHLVGASGSGKSTLLSNMMIQDLDQGNGFACFDPHGDLIDAVLERIPQHRLQDFVIFDPSDDGYPIGFNILSAHSELEKTLLASDLVSIFRRFSTSWGDVMNSILANAVLAFLESERGGNLLDLKRFLIDKNFRENFLTTVKDDEIRYYWLTEFHQLKGKPFAPLLTRLDTFLRSKLIRHIVSAKENRLDFRRMMDERKVLLVRLSLGSIGEENAYLLGSLLVSKLHQATLSRQNIAEENRQPFFLYLDEAHHFVTESMNQILSGVRKYKLGLVLAHQQLRQFQTGESDILASVLANCYTRICFRLDDADAERLAKGFSFFTADHLKNLGVGEAIVRLEQSRYDFNLKAFPLPPTDAATAERARRAIIEQTRITYAQPKSEIGTQNQSSQQADQTLTTQIELQSATQDSHFSDIKSNRQINEKENSIAPVEAHPGRGGRHHQELQAVIKRMAESCGFEVEIEKSVLGGTGSVDVSLQKENLKIACEVSVTSTIDYETKNVLKCLAAGYDYAVVVVSNQKKLPSLETKLQSQVPVPEIHKVKVFGLSGLFKFLRESTAPKDAAQKKPEKLDGQRLNFAEACEFFNINPSTLYRWVREGRVPFYRIGREYQFDREELVLLGKHDLSGKRKASVKLEPLKIEKSAPKNKKEQSARYRKLLKLD